MNFNFGNNLKRLRLSKDLTQEQAAQYLNVSSKAVSRWECGDSMPDVMLLPEIARLYGVTVDDLYKEKSIAYENYAQKLMSVYESTRSQKDFIEADREFASLIKSGEYKMSDLCSYAILYQFHLQYCKNKALELFEKGLEMGEDRDPETYHFIERQRMLLLSQIGESGKNIDEQTERFKKAPEDLYSHINLLVAFLYANDNENALSCFERSKKKFAESSILYAFGGDIYRRLKKYGEAFECWDRALELDPGVTAALYSKADCFEELGEYQNARNVWDQLVDWCEKHGYELEAEEARENADRCVKMYS